MVASSLPIGLRQPTSGRRGWEVRSLVQSSVEEGFLAGQLLIAMPAMTDERFARTVVCICAHSSEGAMGIVVNRPIVRPSFAELVNQLDVQPQPPLRTVPICVGGPVEGGCGFLLHTAEWRDASTLSVTELVSLTASLDVLREVAAGRGPASCLLALGYAGWGAGQLERELQANAWLSIDIDRQIVFDEHYDSKWRRALGSLGVDPNALSGMIGHA